MTENVESRDVCGIVMPISAIDGCSEEHWSDVMTILTEAIDGAGFDANLVSNADDVGIIQKRIIQNLYENPVVVVDVSGKNPNVMFELGMRLAFDRPTIIIKDDKTSYSFDTSPIEHLEYPRDLRFGKIVEFKERLREKITKTYKAAKEDPQYTTFLKHFGEFKVAKLDTKEVTGAEYIIDELKSIRLAMARLEIGGRLPTRNRYPFSSDSTARLEIELDEDNEAEIDKVTSRLFAVDGVENIQVRAFGRKKQISIALSDSCDRDEIDRLIEPLLHGPKRTGPTKRSTGRS